MEIEVEVFGQLLPGQPRHRMIALDRPCTVREVALLLGLQPDEVGLIAINGAQQELEDEVPAGSRVCFFPPISGG